MKKILALMLALCMVLGCTCASASTFDELQNLLRGGSSEPAAVNEPIAADPAPAAPAAQPADSVLTIEAKDGLTVLQSSYIMATEDYSSFIDLYLYVVVRNDSGANIAVDGEVHIFDKANAEIDDQSYLFPRPSDLAPGEVAYLRENILVSKTDAAKLPGDVGAIKVTLCSDGYPQYAEPAEHVSVQAAYTRGYDMLGNPSDNVIRFTVTNNSGKDLVSPTVAGAVYDQNGKLLLVASESLSLTTVVIPAGGTIMMDCELMSYELEMIQQRGATIGTIEAVAYAD